MASFTFNYRSVAEFLKANGETETLGCLKDGARQRHYRKRKNEVDKALREMAKTDPRFAEAVKKARADVAADFDVKKKTA